MQVRVGLAWMVADGCVAGQGEYAGVGEHGYYRGHGCGAGDTGAGGGEGELEHLELVGDQ